MLSRKQLRDTCASDNVEMEKEKMKPDSQAARPLPSPLGVQALHEEQEGEDRASGLGEESKDRALADELELSHCKDDEQRELNQEESNQEVSQGEAHIGQRLSPEQSGSDHEDINGETCIGQELSLKEISSDLEDIQAGTCIGQELSPEETSCNHEGAQGEACIKKELSLEEDCSHRKLSYWDECILDELSLGDVSSCQEVSDWEEFPEEGNTEKEELVPDTSIRSEPLHEVEAESDRVSLLELSEDTQEQERRWGGLAGGRFPMPTPSMAWVELRPSELRSRGPPRASRPHLDPVVPFKKRPSRLRRALRALHSLLCCLAPQPEQ